MTRFVSAEIEPVGSSWKLSITSYSLWSGEWVDVSVHLTLMRAVDALIRHRCGTNVQYATAGGEKTTSLSEYLSGREPLARHAPPFAQGEKKEHAPGAEQ